MRPSFLHVDRISLTDSIWSFSIKGFQPVLLGSVKISERHCKYPTKIGVKETLC